MKAQLTTLLVTGLLVAPRFVDAQTVSFNFSDSAHSVSGWVNAHGDPSLAVVTATDPVTHISISSVSTANWYPYARTAAASDNNGLAADSPSYFFPQPVLLNDWFQYEPGGSGLSYYNQAIPQLIVTGLSVDTVYTVKMSTSNAPAFKSDSTQYTIVGATVYGPMYLNAQNNAAHGSTFTNIAPDNTGKIQLYVSTNGLQELAGISGVQITAQRTVAPTPIVRINSPSTGDILAEDGSFAVNATASESGGTIVRVEFYVDSILLSTSTSSPYSATWVNPDAGRYTLTARAIDGTGNSSTHSIFVSVEPLSGFWSTTGNINMNADSNFIGNVDSIRLAFRTKDIERMSISPIGNVGIGTIAPTAQLHTTGSVRFAGLTADSSQTRFLVADTAGNLYYRAAPSGGGGITGSLAPGQGLALSGGNIALGDSVAGSGAHSFTSNRYQYLNGFNYSIGGSVNDPVTRPVFQVYNNGDFAASSTMDTSVNTKGQTGLRYYSKLGILKIGGSDRLDTTQSPIVYGDRVNSGLLLNSDDSNVIHGRFINTVFAGDGNTIDAGVYLENSIVASETSHYATAMGSMTNSVVTGLNNSFFAPVAGSSITSFSGHYNFPISGSTLNGYQNTAADTAYYSLIAGAQNSFGGLGQLVTGQYHVNRAPYGSTLGNSTVDFSTLSYTGMRGANVSGLGGYPLLAVGNSSAGDGSIHSNALTVLYNGRTQINTSGFGTALAQADVTPKAALEVVSTNTGVLLPKLTTAQVNAIATGDLQNGLLLYNTDLGAFEYYNGTAWSTLNVGSGTTVTGWGATGNSSTNPAVDFVGTTDNEPLVFRTNNVQQMTLLPGGSVGIGTAVMPAADAKLAVNGTIYAQKVKVTQTGWPDYVFNRKFYLPSLSSLERYIKDHGHLPGVVSAQEVAVKGLDVGDNQADLLKKVEMLTLYLIDEHKKGEAQEQEIERLKAQNQRMQDLQHKIDEMNAILKSKGL